MSIASIGDNSGDIDAAQQISENLRDKHRDLVSRAAELADMKERIPASVDNEDDANKISTAIRQCSAFEKANEGMRVSEKEPYLAGGRAVDGFFQTLVKPVSAVKTQLLRVRTAYDTAVAERERRRLEEERKKAEAEQKAAEEAARKLAMDAESAAEHARAADAAAVAEIATVAAEEARQAVHVKPAELTRTRTTEGVVTSLRVKWKGEVIEPAKVPRKFCSPDQRLIDAAIKVATKPDGSCDLIIAGVRIYQDKQSMVR